MIGTCKTKDPLRACNNLRENQGDSTPKTSIFIVAIARLAWSSLRRPHDGTGRTVVVLAFAFALGLARVEPYAPSGELLCQFRGRLQPWKLFRRIDLEWTTETFGLDGKVVVTHSPGEYVKTAVPQKELTLYFDREVRKGKHQRFFALIFDHRELDERGARERGRAIHIFCDGMVPEIREYPLTRG